MLRMRNVSDKFVEKIKTRFIYNIFFKSCPLRDNVESYGTARQDTDGNITRHMRFPCWINKLQAHTQNK